MKKQMMLPWDNFSREDMFENTAEEVSKWQVRSQLTNANLYWAPTVCQALG